MLSKDKITRRDSTLQDVNMIKSRKYIGILLMMGIDSKPEIEMHWEKHGLWTSGLIKKTISRD